MTVRAEIIAIGNELLQGQTPDTNSGWMAKALLSIGVEVSAVRIIGDDPRAIRRALSGIGEADIVLITGGLGPTSDDLTKAVLADFFEDELVTDEAVLDDIRRFLERRGRTDISDLNRAQALVPSRCTVLRNRCGTAPGMWFENDRTIFISMPGVPFEMKEMVREQVIPRIERAFERPAIVQRTALTFGIPEAALAARLSDWEAALPPELTLAYLPAPSGVRVRLTARGRDRQPLSELMDDRFGALEEILEADLYGYDDQTLERTVGRLLTARGATVATAESCTGGSIARLLTSIPGSSDYYLGSVVSYANEIKQRLLGVDPQVLAARGAVSREVVEQMARGALARMGTDYAVATSGIAGPGGGTREKPVGTTWIAAASSHTIVSKRYQFGELRHVNIDRSSYTALDMLRRLIIETGQERTDE